MRPAVVRLVLALVLVAGVLAALMLGTRPLSIPDVIAALAPDATGPDRLVVVGWRAPRALSAALFGGCLALSGALVQSLTRNPLGSPDVIGLNTGAYAGVVGVILLGGSGWAALATGALVGGFGTAVVVYLLAFRQGIRGFRLVIVGIAVSAVLSSLTTWFSVKADLDVAMRAAVWGAGTLSGTGWPVLTLSAGIAALLGLGLPAAGRWLRHLELGDDTAAAQGVPVEPAKALVLTLGVALTALVTATTGPVAFVALAAPQIARRLTGRAAGAELPGSALVGSVLLVGADLVAQHAIRGVILPVGAVTVCLGGGYLIWLLARESRRG